MKSRSQRPGTSFALGSPFYLTSAYISTPYQAGVGSYSSTEEIEQSIHLKQQDSPLKDSEGNDPLTESVPAQLRHPLGSQAAVPSRGFLRSASPLSHRWPAIAVTPSVGILCPKRLRQPHIRPDQGGGSTCHPDGTPRLTFLGGMYRQHSTDRSSSAVPSQQLPEPGGRTLTCTACPSS